MAVMCKVTMDGVNNELEAEKRREAIRQKRREEQTAKAGTAPKRKTQMKQVMDNMEAG